MINSIFKNGILTAAAFAALATAAQAGGFSRGEADTDILYEDGAVDFRAKATYVAPQRGYETINGVTATDGDYTDSFFIPSVAAKARISDSFSCAATYTQPFGASSTYGRQTQLADQKTSSLSNYTTEADFVSNEYGLTCAVKMDLEKGRVHFMGGLFVQDFEYTEKTFLGTLRLEDSSELGYRLGAAYEIPEIALRADIMYRSKVEHSGSGEFTLTAAGAAGIKQKFGLTLPVGAQLPASGAGTLPQSLEIGLQSGIAPGWLAFGSVKWTDWSVLPSLNYNIRGIGDLKKNFKFRDGWTVTGGVGHTFTDDISGAVSVTWDRGVGTGADIMTDTWTVGLGAAIKAGPGELRLGGAVSYLTSGSQKYQGADYADYNATVGSDFAYGANVSYLVKF